MVTKLCSKKLKIPNVRSTYLFILRITINMFSIFKKHKKDKSDKKPKICPFEYCFNEFLQEREIIKEILKSVFGGNSCRSVAIIKLVCKQWKKQMEEIIDGIGILSLPKESRLDNIHGNSDKYLRENKERTDLLCNFLKFENISIQRKSKDNYIISCIDFCLSDKKECIEKYLNYYSFWKKAVDMRIEKVVWVNQNREKLGLYEEHVGLIENNGVYGLEYFVVVSEKFGREVVYSSRKVTFYLKNDINIEPFDPYDKNVNPFILYKFPYSENIALFLIDNNCNYAFNRSNKGFMPFSAAHTRWLVDIHSNNIEGTVKQVAMVIDDDSCKGKNGYCDTHKMVGQCPFK